MDLDKEELEATKKYNEEKEYLKAIEKIKNEYDAYYFENKYGENTHKKEFELLSKLKGDKVESALSWIKKCYDCYYKDELSYDNPFNYLVKCVKK